MLCNVSIKLPGVIAEDNLRNVAARLRDKKVFVRRPRSVDSFNSTLLLVVLCYTLGCVLLELSKPGGVELSLKALCMCGGQRG